MDLPYTDIHFYISLTALHLSALWVQLLFAAFIAAIETTASGQAKLAYSSCNILWLLAP